MLVGYTRGQVNQCLAHHNLWQFIKTVVPLVFTLLIFLLFPKDAILNICIFPEDLDIGKHEMTGSAKFYSKLASQMLELQAHHVGTNDNIYTW